MCALAALVNPASAPAARAGGAPPGAGEALPDAGAAATEPPAPAVAAAEHGLRCEPLPEPVEELDPIRVDLNRDGRPDFLIPVECDGRQNCAMAVLLAAHPCPVALGRLGDASGRDYGVNGRRANAIRALPLTSHGVVLVIGEADLHHAMNTSVWAWDGSGWIDVHDDYYWREIRNDQVDSGHTSGMTAGAASVCLDRGAPIAAFDLDGDGHRDSVYRVPCRGGDDRRGCGNWITVTRNECRIPIGVLADGTVTLMHPAGHDQPAVVRVTPGGRSRAPVEYRFDQAPESAAGLALSALRLCDARRCADWVPADQPEPER